MAVIVSVDIGIRNFAMCVVRFETPSSPPEILHWRASDLNVDRRSVGGRTSVTYDVTARNLLNDAVQTYTPTHILFEQQSFRNSRALALVNYLRGYTHGQWPAIRVFTVAPAVRKNKRMWEHLVQLGCSPDSAPSSDDSATASHAQDTVRAANRHFKKRVAQGALFVVKQYCDTAWANLLETAKKKDDLADTFIQILAYMYNSEQYSLPPVRV